MLTKPQQSPIRPPSHRSRKCKCVCGRKPGYRSWAPHSNHQFRVGKHHDLCMRCWGALHASTVQKRRKRIRSNHFVLLNTAS